MRDWNETMGQNNQDVSNVNKSALLKFLRQNGVCSRAQISKAMGLTQASISKITAQLLEENIVQETGYISGEKGRRSVGITFNTRCKKVLGVRISRRSFGVGLFDLSGKMYESMTRQFTAETTLHHVIARIRDILQGYLEQSSEIAAIGVAVPGPINLRTSEIVLTTSMATSDWTNLNLRQEFGEFAVPISFSHDADAGALADWWFSTKAAGLGATLVHFLVGDGVGAGCVSNGEILNGYRRFSEEIGHVSVDVNGPKCRCGNRGCLELYCSTFAFMDFVSQGLPLHPESPLYRIGDLSPRDGVHRREERRPLCPGLCGPLGPLCGLWGGEPYQRLCPGPYCHQQRDGLGGKTAVRARQRGGSGEDLSRGGRACEHPAGGRLDVERPHSVRGRGSGCEQLH